MHRFILALILLFTSVGYSIENNSELEMDLVGSSTRAGRTELSEHCETLVQIGSEFQSKRLITLLDYKHLTPEKKYTELIAFQVDESIIDSRTAGFVGGTNCDQFVISNLFAGNASQLLSYSVAKLDADVLLSEEKFRFKLVRLVGDQATLLKWPNEHYPFEKKALAHFSIAAKTWGASLDLDFFVEENRDIFYLADGTIVVLGESKEQKGQIYLWRVNGSSLLVQDKTEMTVKLKGIFGDRFNRRAVQLSNDEKVIAIYSRDRTQAAFVNTETLRMSRLAIPSPGTIASCAVNARKAFCSIYGNVFDKAVRFDLTSEHLLKSSNPTGTHPSSWINDRYMVSGYMQNNLAVVDTAPDSPRVVEWVDGCSGSIHQFGLLKQWLVLPNNDNPGALSCVFGLK